MTLAKNNVTGQIAVFKKILCPHWTNAPHMLDKVGMRPSR